MAVRFSHARLHARLRNDVRSGRVEAELGSGDDSICLAEEEGIKTVMASPGSREWWDENPYGFCTEFRSYVAGLAPTPEFGA